MSPRKLPPTPKGRRYEIRGQALREFARLHRDEEPLDPFELADAARLFVAPYDQIAPNLSEATREHLLGPGKDAWSGGAASIALPNGRKLIILNPSHGSARQRATLMEEISHLFLGHKPSRLAVETTNRKGETAARDYHQEIEEEAYATGAAALVPYSALHRMILAGKTSREIARHFAVSRPLVEYRIKVSRLWPLYARNVFQGSE